MSRLGVIQSTITLYLYTVLIFAVLLDGKWTCLVDMQHRARDYFSARTRVEDQANARSGILLIVFSPYNSPYTVQVLVLRTQFGLQSLSNKDSLIRFRREERRSTSIGCLCWLCTVQPIVRNKFSYCNLNYRIGIRAERKTGCATWISPFARQWVPQQRCCN